MLNSALRETLDSLRQAARVMVDEAKSVTLPGELKATIYQRTPEDLLVSDLKYLAFLIGESDALNNRLEKKLLATMILYVWEPAPSLHDIRTEDEIMREETTRMTEVEGLVHQLHRPASKEMHKPLLIKLAEAVDKDKTDYHIKKISQLYGKVLDAISITDGNLSDREMQAIREIEAEMGAKK